MQTLITFSFSAFLVLSIGSCLLGWAGKMHHAVASLMLSVAGLAITSFLAEPLGASGDSGIPTWLFGVAACFTLFATIAMVVGRYRSQNTVNTNSEPDYKAIGQSMLNQMDANVEARKAARKA